MVRRDRNHPSVFLWSVFNEEPMQGSPQGREMVRRMVSEVRRLDPTRPVTAAMNGGMNNAEGVFEAVDVMGFNYCDHAYDSFHAKHPHLPVFSSEDTSAFMTRGEYANDPERKGSRQGTSPYLGRQQPPLLEDHEAPCRPLFRAVDYRTDRL
jgi:beta-galactosidase